MTLPASMNGALVCKQGVYVVINRLFADAASNAY